MPEPRDPSSIGHTSSQADHPDIREVLPQFIARLPEQVRRLRALQAGADATGLIQLVHQLRGSGKSFGFALISQHAEAIETLLLAGRPVLETSAALAQLIAYMENIEGYG